MIALDVIPCSPWVRVNGSDCTFTTSRSYPVLETPQPSTPDSALALLAAFQVAHFLFHIAAGDVLVVLVVTCDLWELPCLGGRWSPVGRPG